MLEEACDFGVAGRRGRIDDLDYHPIRWDAYGLVCSPDHPLAGRKSLTLDDLHDERVVALAPQTGIRNALEASTGLDSRLWSSDIEASSNLTLTMILKQNVGVAVMPELAAQLPAMGTLAFVPISDLRMRRELFLITKLQRGLTPAAQALASEVVRSAEALFGAAPERAPGRRSP